MGWFNELEYARYPDEAAVWKAVGYSVGAAHSQVNIGRGTDDTFGTPPAHQVLRFGPGCKQFLWR